MGRTRCRRGLLHLKPSRPLKVCWLGALLVVLAAGCGGDEEGVGTISIKGGGGSNSSKTDTKTGPDGGSDVTGSDAVSVVDAGAGSLDVAAVDTAPVVDTMSDAVGDMAQSSDAKSAVVTDSGAADTVMDAGPPPGCVVDGDCTPFGLVCDVGVAGGACVQCNYGSDCKGLFALCDQGKCVNQPPCANDTSCKAVGQVCDSLSGHCVDCTEDKDCGNGWFCKAATCIPPPTTCQSSKSCAALGQVCDKQASACVDCLDGADCEAKEFCWQGVCVADICKPGLVQCATGDSLQTCDPSGSGWVIQPCPKGNGCHQGVCAPTICTGGESKCVDGAVLTCLPTGTAWAPPVKCPDGALCIEGVCKTAICKPGATKCDPGGKATCSADGTNWKSAPCPAGKSCKLSEGIALCLDHVCKPSTSFCDAGKTWLCAADGMSSKSVDDCTSKGLKCANGACVPESCKPAEVACKEGQVAVCDASGKAWILQACGDGKICKAGVCAQPGPCTTPLKAEGKTPKADIIVAIDTSSSMKDEFKQVNGALGALGQALKDGGVDHRVVVIGSNTDCCKICVPPPLGKKNCAAGPNLKRVVAYTTGGSQIKTLVDFWSIYKSFLRADADRHIIIISDDDSDVSASKFKDNINKLSAPGFPNGFVLHAIVSIGGDSKKGCDSGDDPSKVAIQLATETGGHKYPVCEKKGDVWKGWFKAIAGDIGKGGMTCTYPLSAPMKSLPDLAKTLKITAIIGGKKTTLAPLAAGKPCGQALEYHLLGQPPAAVTLCASSCALIKGSTLTAEHACP